MYLEDVLYHYRQKTNMALDGVEQNKKDFIEMLQRSEEAWEGLAAECFAEKLMIFEKDRQEIEEHLTQAAYYLWKLAQEIERKKDLFYEYQN